MLSLIVAIYLLGLLRSTRAHENYDQGKKYNPTQSAGGREETRHLGYSMIGIKKKFALPSASGAKLIQHK